LARFALLLLGIGAAGVLGLGAARSTSDGEQGQARMLRVLTANPRYFTDGSGRAVYLTGSHVWWSLVGSRTWKVE
jgi:hypothetical protein